MRTGFIIEAHTVIRCDGCGDPYYETGSIPSCFASVGQAVAFITRRGNTTGWMYDGDRIWCDGCQAIRRCIEQGHTFPEPRRRLLGSTPDPHTCTVCGISDTEIEE